MAKLPILNARVVFRALKRAGFVEDPQKVRHPIIHPDEMHSGRTIKELLA
jgi:predicted RNA binding protein YcfA (HicA-like mRNA interferase family)